MLQEPVAIHFVEKLRRDREPGSIAGYAIDTAPRTESGLVVVGPLGDLAWRVDRFAIEATTLLACQEFFPVSSGVAVSLPYRLREFRQPSLMFCLPTHSQMSPGLIEFIHSVSADIGPIVH